MGGCANSKYAVDEDKQQVNKKEKKPFLKMPKLGVHAKSNGKKAAEAAAADSNTPAANGTVVQSPDTDHKHTAKGEKEDIDFIDKEEAERAKAANASTNETVKSDDDAKKEVTTYQTTVVKHTQKEGDELLQHLKDEAFKTLQGLLKQQQQQQQQQPQSPNTATTKTTTTASSSSNTTPETSESSPNDNIIEQIKAQVVTAVGKTNQDIIHSIIDSGENLITENKVKSMAELQHELERLYPDRNSQQATTSVDGTAESAQAPISNSELVKKVVNATTGFLTAKGTEAGALLSNILANVSTGIHGVMNETEKTTVKVTRTVTEQIISGGQIKEITRVITEPVKAGASASSNIQDILKNLSNGVNLSTLVGSGSGNASTDGSDAPVSPTKQVNTGTTITTSSTIEKHEIMPKEKLASSPPPSSSSLSSSGLVSSSSVETNNDELTKRQAEQVVSSVVSAAVGKMINETNGTSDDAPVTTNGIITNGVMNGHHDAGEHIENGLTEQITEENIKIEEEKTIKTSTTKIKVNGLNNSASNASTDADVANISSELDSVQSEFYKHGKHAAEEAVKKVEITTTQVE